jgi:hypothetical protein
MHVCINKLFILMKFSMTFDYQGGREREHIATRCGAQKRATQKRVKHRSAPDLEREGERGYPLEGPSLYFELNQTKSSDPD